MCQRQVLSVLWFDVLVVWYTYVLTCALYLYTSLHLCTRISDVADPCIHRTGDDPSSNTVAGVATTETRLCVRISSDPSYGIFELIDSLSVSLFFPPIFVTLTVPRFLSFCSFVFPSSLFKLTRKRVWPSCYMRDESLLWCRHRGFADARS